MLKVLGLLVKEITFSGCSVYRMSAQEETEVTKKQPTKSSFTTKSSSADNASAVSNNLLAMSLIRSSLS